MAGFFSKLFPNNSLKRLEGVVSLINEQEESLKNKSVEELKVLSLKLKERMLAGESEEKLLPEAFALVREASRRTLGQRHFDVQLIGGIVLHEGKIAEMLTGEGKTLAATLPAYFNALNAKGVHVVTVNDYLARRDTVWMGQIYHALGLKVACIVHEAAYIYDPSYTREKFEILNSKSETNLNAQNPRLRQGFGGQANGKSELDKQRDLLGSFKVFEEFLRPISRKEAYEVDITYGTNHEFGFDFLRDNLNLRLGERVQCGHHYAIIDEVDSILIDEARTPLIIAAPDQESSGFYKTFAHVVEHLNAEDDYVTDEKLKVVNITEPGIEKVEKMLNVQNIFAPENARLVHFLQESLKAKALFKLDRDYVIKNNEVIIVDEFTGRMLLGRRYSGGLHQAIEAKENVPVKEENRTFAQITIQNYFRLYKKIAGMTGTAQTSAEEFHKVYNLEVVSIPPNRPMIREDGPDAIYKNKDAKYRAVVKDVKERHEKGQPILLGTTSISNNEIISAYLTEAGVSHEVLNAKNNEREGAIIAQAGKFGAVTVATNMAGRGVDIILGGNPPDTEAAKKIKELGGLHVIGTERHESRRIDNQLRGRSGRQGDLGSSQFFLSLEDDLMRIFGGERIANIMKAVDFPEDTPIESKMVSKAVNQAQAKVEGFNLDARRHLLDFDDVLNKQRSAIYKKREEILLAGEENNIQPILIDILNNFLGVVENNLPNITDAKQKEESEKKIGEFREKLAKLPENLEPERNMALGQHLVRILDMLWVSHLENLEGLRESVNIRAFAQHEPIVEYRREAHLLYKQLNDNFESLVSNTVWPILELDLSRITADQRTDSHGSISGNQRGDQRSSNQRKLGRNDPCWCGAKYEDGRPKKYKKCHGA